MSTDLVTRLRMVWGALYAEDRSIAAGIVEEAADAIASLRAQAQRERDERGALQAHAADLDSMVAALRGLLGRMQTEFGDYHYEGCPADLATGDGCTCFAGALLRDVRAALEA